MKAYLEEAFASVRLTMVTEFHLSHSHTSSPDSPCWSQSRSGLICRHGWPKGFQSEQIMTRKLVSPLGLINQQGGWPQWSIPCHSMLLHSAVTSGCFGHAVLFTVILRMLPARYMRCCISLREGVRRSSVPYITSKARVGNVLRSTPT